MVVHGEEDHYAAILALGTHAPFLKKTVGEVLGGVAFQRVYRDHGDLGAGLGVEFLAELGELLLGCGVNYAGEIVNVPLRRELLDLLRAS